MNKWQIIEKSKALIPYFLLAVAIIIAFRLSGSLGAFGDALMWVWVVLSPFFYGLLLAYLINIPCSSMQRLLARSKNQFVVKRQRGLSVLIVMILIFGLIALALSFIIPAIINSIGLFIYNIDVYWAGVIAAIDWFNALEIIDPINEGDIFDWFAGLFADFSFDNLAGPLNAILGLGNSIFIGFIALISSIYIVIEKDKIKAATRRLFRIFTNRSFSSGVTDTFARLSKYFKQYLRTQTIDSIILAAMTSVALLILGSPFWLVIAISLGILNYIPLFGSLFGTIAAILIVMFTQGFATGIIAAVVLTIIQQIGVNIIQPRLMGSSFKFSPLMVIVAITVGGAIWGVFGMIIAIPVAKIIKDVYDEVLNYYERKKFGLAQPDPAENDPPVEN